MNMVQISYYVRSLGTKYSNSHNGFVLMAVVGRVRLRSCFVMHNFVYVRKILDPAGKPDRR